MVRGAIQEFTVLDVTNITRKLVRFCISVMNGGLKFNCEDIRGYSVTMGHHEEIIFQIMIRVQLM